MRLKHIVILFSILFLSCSKDNDAKLEGRWQVTTIESPRHFVETDSLFWSFDSGVCEIQTLQASTPHYAEQIFANYLIEEDSIKISIPDKYYYLANKNKYLDWNTAERKFAIRELTPKSLKLSVNDTIYSFRKYY
jgi:hypothetical protein